MFKTKDYTIGLRGFFMALMLLSLGSINAQKKLPAQVLTPFTLAQAQEWARANYPLIAKLDLLKKSTAYSIRNVANANLPKVTINGQLSYQSEVTEIPIELPNLDIPTLANDQYKLYADAYLPLTGFSLTKSREKSQSLNGEIKRQQVEIDLYKLRNRVNQLYFGVLLLRVKEDQLGLIQADLDSTIEKIEASISNGVATTMDRNLLQVESLKVVQQMDAIKAQKTAFLSMLSSFIGHTVSNARMLIRPSTIGLNETISRPEIQFFKLQKQAIDLQQTQTNLQTRPTLGLFLQGGFGRPALNFLSNDFAAYYIAGARFSWNLSATYNTKSDKRNLSIQQQMVTADQEAFLFNTKLNSKNQSAEIEQYEQLIISDMLVIDLQDEIKTTAEVQLQNGIITTLDYIKILNESSRANQQLELHRLMLLQAQSNFNNTLGN